MTPDQVKAIQESFAKVAPISEQAAALFYGRLFEIAPAVKPLFRGDMKEQGRKLMATLGVVVNGLSNLESILPAASALASRKSRSSATAAALTRCRSPAAVKPSRASSSGCARQVGVPVCIGSPVSAAMSK